MSEARDYVSFPHMGRILGVCPSVARAIAHDEGMDVIRPRKQDRVRRRDVIAYRNKCQRQVERAPHKANYERVLVD